MSELTLCMTNRIPSCDDYQVAFDMSQHASQSAISTRELDEHFGKCDVCSAYGELSLEIASAPSAIDSQRLHRLVKKQVRRQKLELRLFVPFAYAVIIGSFFYHRDLMMMMSMLIFTAPFMLAIVRRRHNNVGTELEDFTSMIRSELRRDARLLRLAAILFPIVFILAAYLIPGFGNEQVGMPLTTIIVTLFGAFLEYQRREVMRRLREFE